MDPALITALSGMTLGMLGIVISYITHRSAATRSEVDSLRMTIVTLSAENARLSKRVGDLERENMDKDRRIDELEREVEKLQRENNSLKSGKR